MPVTIDATKYIVGAADVYYRALAGTGPWTSIGATVDDIMFRVHQSSFNPSDKFNGILEQVKGMDYLSRATAEAEFTMPEIAGTKLAIALRSVVSAVSPTADSGGSPFSTTLAAAAVVGDTNIKVTAITNAALGQYFRIETGATIEYRVITFIGTAGAGGTGVGFRDPLLLAHANAAVVVQTTGDGKTELTQGLVRRMPDTAYNDFVLIAQSPASYYELFLYNAIATQDAAELAFGNETMAAIKVTIGARRDGLNLALPSWRLRVP